MAFLLELFSFLCCDSFFALIFSYDDEIIDYDQNCWTSPSEGIAIVYKLYIVIDAHGDGQENLAHDYHAGDGEEHDCTGTTKSAYSAG